MDVQPIINNINYETDNCWLNISPYITIKYCFPLDKDKCEFRLKFNREMFGHKHGFTIHIHTRSNYEAICYTIMSCYSRAYEQSAQQQLEFTFDDMILILNQIKKHKALIMGFISYIQMLLYGM